MTIVAFPAAHRITGTGAQLSDDGLYRYTLWRNWSPEEQMVWIMLNPSTADAALDDPTIRRCVGFAKREGCGGIVVINLWALRTTKPAHLLDYPDPEGPDNSEAWARVLLNHRGPVVAAWGAWPSSRAADDMPISWARYNAPEATWLCLGTTQSGDPRHPLYVKADAPLGEWR